MNYASGFIPIITYLYVIGGGVFPVTVNFRITDASDNRITDAGDYRITDN